MADGLLNWYKGELEKQGKDVSRFTDNQLIYEIGRKLEAKEGIQAVEQYPDFAKQYKKINNDLRAKRLGRDGFFGPIKEIGAGFGQGIDETQAMIQGGIGAGLKTVGLDSAGDSMMDAAMANLKESQVDAPTIQSYQDVTGIGDAVRYLTGGLGRVLPSAGTMLATGGVTGAVGKKVLEKSVVGPALRKALKDNATKNIAKEGLKKETFDQLSPDAQDIVKAYAYGVSQNVGVGTASGTMGIGEVYTSLYPYTQLDPQDKDYLTEGEALRTSWMFGTAIGSLDSILPSMVGKSVQRKFFKGKSPDAVDLAKADNFTKRSILALTAKGMAVEAGTEATQEYLNVVADKFAHDEKSPFDLSQFTDQEIATMIDAGILGSIGGGVFGVAGGKIENWQTDRKVEQVTKEKVEKARDAEKRVKDILDKLAGETDVVPTFTKGDSVFDVAEGKEYEFVSATGEVAKVKDGEETKEVSIRNLTQTVKKQEEQAETTEETTEDVQDVVQSFQDDIPEKKIENEALVLGFKSRSKDGDASNPEFATDIQIKLAEARIKQGIKSGKTNEEIHKDLILHGFVPVSTHSELERGGAKEFEAETFSIHFNKVKGGDKRHSALSEKVIEKIRNGESLADLVRKPKSKPPSKPSRAEVLARFEEARNVQLELENDEGKVITISAPQARVLEIVGDSNYKQEISKDDYKTWADEFYAPGQQPSKKEMSVTYDQAFEARYPKLLKELQETKDTAEEAKKTGTEKKEKDETFLRNDVIADKNLKAGAKVTLNQRGRLQANSALGLDVDQARQEFQITEIDDQGFVKIKGGGVTLKQGVDPRNFNKFVEKTPPKPKVATPAPIPPTPPKPVVEEIDGSELTEIPQPKEGKYVITLENGVNKPFEITIDGNLMWASKGFQMEEGLSLADAIVKKFEKAGEGAKLYEIKSLSVPGVKNIGVTFDGIAINYDINSENKSQVISREASENNGLWKYGTGDDKGETRIDTGTNQRQVQFIDSAVFEDTPSVGSFTEKLDRLYGDKKKYDKSEIPLDPRPAGSTMVVAIRHNPSGTIIVRSIVNKEGKIYNISSRTKKGLDLRDSSIDITYKELLGLENFTVLQIARFNAARGKFRDQFENISEYEAWIESIPKAKELEGVSGMTQSKLNDAYAAYKKYKEGLALTDNETKLLEDTFEYTLDDDGNAVFDKESDPVVSYSLRYFTPTDSKYGRLKLVEIVDEIEGEYLKDATNASQLYDRLPVEEKKDFSYFPKVIKELKGAVKSLTDESGNQLIDNRSVVNFAKLVLKAVYQRGKTDVTLETKRGQGGISLDQSIQNQDGEGLSVGDTIPEEENVSHLEKQSPDMVDFPADRAEEIFKVFFPQGSREQLNILHQYAQGLSPDESDVGVLMDTNRNIKYSEDNTPASVQESMTPDALHYYGEQNGAEPYWAFLQWLSNFPKLPDALSKVIEQDANQDAIPTESDIDFQKEVLAEYNRLGKEIDIKNAVNQATRELFEVSYGIEANDPSPTSQSNAQSFSGVEKGIEKAYFHALNTAQKRNANYEVEDFIIQILDIFDKDTSSELTSRIMEAIEAEGNEIDTNAKLKSLFSEVLGDELGDRFTAVFDSLSDSALEIFGSKAGGIVMFGNLTAGGSVFHLNISQFKEENTSAGVGNRESGNVPLHNPINNSIGSADPTPGKKFNGGKVDPLNESEEAAKVLSQENDNGPAMTKVFDISPEQMSEIKERNREIIDEVLDNYELGGAAALENINNEEFVSEEAEQFIEEIINVLDEGMKAALNEGRDIKVDVAELPQPRQGITRAQFNPDTSIITIDPRFYLGEKDTSITPYEITGDRNRDVLITAFIHEAWHATLDTPIDVHEKALIEGKTTKYAETYDLMQQVIKELSVLDKGNQYGLLNEDAVVESLNRIWTRPDFARWVNGQKLSGELQKKIDAHTKTSSGSILDALHALYIKLLELMDISIVEGNSFDSLIRLSKKMQEVHDTTAETPEISIIEKSELDPLSDSKALKFMLDPFPTNSEISLDVIQDYKSKIYEDYLDAFAEDTESGDVSDVINNTPKDKLDKESIEILEPNLRVLLRALEKDDWFGFDYPSQSVQAIFEDGTYELYDVSPSTKAAITRYVNQVATRDAIRKDTRTHIRLEADGDGYIVTNLEDKPVRLSLEEAKKIVRFKDNPSRVGRIKLKGDGSELTKTEEEGGKFVEYVRVIENGNDFWVKRDDIEAYDRGDTIKQMSDQLTFDFDKSEEQVEKEKKLAPEVVDTPKYTPQQLTAVVAKNISWGSDNDGIDRSIARKISNGTGIPYNRVLNEIYVLNRMHEDTPIRYRTKFMDEAERGYKRYYGRRKFMVDELDPNIEDRSDEIVGKKPVIEQNKRDTIRMEAASINEVSGVIAQAIQVVREKMGIEDNITADSILKVLGVKGTRPGRRMQALLKLSGGDETMKTTTTGSMRNNENMYQEANERSLQKLDAIINNANKEKTGALELIKQNEEKIEENSEIKPDSSFIFNLAKTGDKLRKEIVKQLENTATALNNNEEYANDPILKAFEKLKGENESADIEQLKRASKISGKYITDLIDKVINSGGDITLEKLYNNISLDIKDDRAVVLAAVLTSKAGIEQIAFRMLARSGNVNQKRTTIEKLVDIYKANEMQLAQIKRVVGSDEYRATYDVPFIKGANNPEYIVINEFIARREEIFKRQKQNKELAKRIQGIDALTSVVAQASERKKILLRHNPASYIMDGTEMPVMKKEGDEYVMDKITVRLNNSLKPADYEEFKKALIANRQYLMDPNLVKDQVDENGYALFGSTTYNYVKSMTLKGEALTVFREHEEAVRGLKTWWLKSNPDLWKRFGTEGREIARMLISADVASREAMPRFRTGSKKYNRALLTAAREMGYVITNKTFGIPTQEVDMNGFVDHVIDPLLKWNEDNPSFGSLTRKEFYAKAYDYAKNLIGDRQPSPEARNALYELLDNYDNMTIMLKQLGEKHGLYVQNDRRKVMNYFTGKMEPVSRAPIKRGYMTVPRKFKSGFVGYLVRKMADNKGWADRDSELSKAQLTEYVSGSATDEEKNALMDQWIDTRIDEDILEEFIYPYVKNTSPRHLLTNVEGTAISTADMMDAWAKSEGRGAERFKSWIDALYGKRRRQDKADYTAFKLKVINAFNGRFFQMHSALELSGKANDNKAYAMAHALMDSRAQDAIIPIEFLEYQTFDEVSTVIQVEQIIGHAIYGRSGEKLNTMIDNLGNSLGGRVSKLGEEVRRVGGKMADGQEPILTQTQKNEIINNIGEEEFDSLIRAVRNFSNFTKAKDQLGKYLTSDGGPTKDEKFAFDALGTMAFLILQQVKSGLTNILSLGDQMVVYKGLNKYSIKATANSASNLMGQFFGGLLENLGVQLKGNEYAEQLMPTFFNTEENSVGFMDYTLNIGARGAKKASKLETFKLDGLRRLRQAMTYSPVSEGRRTAPVGLRTLFLHPFTYLSNLTNHSLAVSAARMVDGMVREVTAFLEANPNLPQDYEVTADDLGLKSGVTGSSKELFEYINNSLEERTLGTITNLSRKYIDRKARGDMRVLTKDQVLAVGTIALHKVAMEGGFVSKPSFMQTNQLARAGAPLQAWSFAKVDQMMEQMRDQEKGNYQAAAMIRLLATTAFWLVPVGMMFTFGMDEYDEEVLGKASALRPAPLSTAIPIFGPFIEGDPKGNALAMFERLGRAGNIGGVAFDFLANMMADIDPYNHNRGFSLDTRILAMAQILNLKDAIKNIIHSGTFDYQLVQRPLMYTMGMNGYLQTHQAITNLFDIDSDERRVSNMIGNRNKVRAALANLGIERAPMTGGSFRATRFSVQIRRMERAAYANDSEEFRDAYREAIEASAERGDEDPEKSVLQAFKRRNLRSGISKYKLSDDEWRKVQGVFTDEHASSLRHAMSMHEKFVNILESSSAVLPSPVMDSTSTNPVPFVAPISYNEIIRRSLQL